MSFINLSNDILELIEYEYKKNNIYWEYSSIPSIRKSKEFWVKKYVFDQLFINYKKRYNGKVYYNEYRPIINNGNLYETYISLNVNDNSEEYKKIIYMNARYKLFNSIIMIKDIKTSHIKNSIKDKKHYLELEEYMDCVLNNNYDIKFNEYKKYCFVKNCEQCNRIKNYSNNFLIDDNYYTIFDDV